MIKNREALIDQSLRELWKVPLYDIEGQKEVLRKMLENSVIEICATAETFIDEGEIQ